MSTLANASVDSRGQPCESPSPSMNFLQYMSISLSSPEGLFAHSAGVTPLSDWRGGVIGVGGGTGGCGVWG